MNKRKIAFLAASLFFSTGLFAQTQLKGRVVDGNGAPIPGVTLSLKDGTATQTGTNGEFSITYDQAGQLNISAIGYSGKMINLSNQTSVEIILNSATEDLDEVIVTALGISRDKKSLGYAAQQVNAKELTQAGPVNVTNALSGKVAGVQVNQFGGTVGASARISLRGNSGVRADQQPLIVVDGVPISNDTQRSGDNTYSGVDYGSGINDINPEDIESMTVLKGGSAALYGMRAGNGVILITTKSGKKGQKGIKLSYDGNFSVDKASYLPKIQNLYGQGFNGDEFHYNRSGGNLSYQDYARSKAFAYDDGTGSGNGVNDGFDESWGPRLDVGLKLPQFDSPVENGIRQATDWMSHKNNIRDFFQVGHSMNHNLSLLAQSEKSSTRASLSFRDQVGTVPNTDQKRYGIQLNNNTTISDKVSFDVSTNYTRTESDNIVSQGYDGNNPMNGFIWSGRQINMQSLKNNWDQRDERGDYTLYNWNTNYHVNPYFNVHENTNSYKRDRFFGKTSLYYQPFEFLKFEGRAGLDYYSAQAFEKNYFNSAFPFGGFRDRKTDNTELNLDFIASFNKQYGDFNVLALAGANYRDVQWGNSVIGADALAVLGVYTVANKMGDAISTMDHTHVRSNSVFASANLGWRDQLYLDVSARNDWSSTIKDDFFYPSASLSWLPTSTFENLKGDVLSFWKLRGGWAEIGAGASAYQNRAYYYAQDNAFNGVAQMYHTMTLPNEQLKPESVRTWEVGTEIGLFNDRLHADIAYYYKNTRDQILEVATSNVVGFNRMLLNAGEIENKGIEIQLRGDIIKKDDGFNWSTTVNYAKDNSKVIELYPQLDLDTYQIGWTWGVANVARKGEQWGTLVGGGYDRVEEGPMKGAIKVNNTGLVVNKSGQEIGNVTPNFLASWRNDFTYKDFSFGFLLDLRVGGDIWSQTMSHAYGAGVAAITVEDGVRERAIVAGRDVMKDEKFAMMDGDGNWVENTIETDAQTWYRNGGISEMYVFDGSFLKLREAYLTYNVPSRYLQNLKGISRVNVSLIGSNLALLWTHKSNTMRIDPETGGVSSDSRGVGFEQASVPTSRSFGLKLGVSF
ncbi:SusC/RagA family TonB-linked outer membrane protein [Sphingobacterium shayense]|uniref:SusC/RagA family TonB-linked outer membrane protein n=1 Tax=Sphingobacterium shayense TaxID=626343 RepID=UPI00155666F3|nr:SusC/RagA family TonB-linked outer membrane protein [Sphingobacterium shayense]NQD71507.1 SusC/RagA family TonB-linked outer membrane protein [Sphingobacterium shayense]